MLGPILASLERVEIERVEEIIEYVGGLHQMGKLDWETAVALLRMQTDLHLYEGLIGRNANFRWTDHSSVWQNPNPWRHLRRALMPEGTPVMERMRRERPIYQNQTHDQLGNFPLLLEAFGERLRMLEMIRHPVDVVGSWMRRSWGTRFGSDPLALTLCIRHNGMELPYYAAGWEVEYRALDPLSRVTRMIARLWEQTQQVYRSLDAAQRGQVFIVPFEAFVARPMPYVEAIAHWLGTKPTRHTPGALRRQRCPRAYDRQDRARRHQALLGALGPIERGLLERMVEEYEAAVEAAQV
jgi:hypothetical protein